MEKLLYSLEKVAEFWKRAPKGPLLILTLLFTMGIFADFLSFGHDPEVGDPRLRLLPPFWYEAGITKYPLGTDTMGRDILTRLIYGSRVSLVVAFAAVIVSSVIGTILGILAGYYGGWVDQVVMRFTDAWLSIPTVMFGILLAVIVGPGVSNIIIVMGLVYWTRYARVTRGETLSLKTREFVQLAIVDGCSKFRIMRKHILPNVMNNVITLASMQIGVVVVVEATLTFLGVGVPPPKPAWGLM